MFATCFFMLGILQHGFFHLCFQAVFPPAQGAARDADATDLEVFSRAVFRGADDVDRLRLVEYLPGPAPGG
ncbi:hypothetical protein D3C78_1593190 [compost metagenome]